MANTFTSLHYHIVFSTKHREPWLRPDDQERLWAYLGGIARENELIPLLIGGVEDHVHMLLGIPPVIPVSQALQQVKGGSSGWIKQNLPGCRGFGWQDGYGAFTVSKSQEEPVKKFRRRYATRGFRPLSPWAKAARLPSRHRYAMQLGDIPARLTRGLASTPALKTSNASPSAPY